MCSSIHPAAQHDSLTATKLVNKLLVQGIEVQQARAEFNHEGKVYGAGSFVVSMAQPKMGVIRYLLGRTFYPDNSYTRDKDGNPIRPYDMATDTMAEFMGVKVEPVDTPIGAQMAKVTAPIERAGRVEKGASGYVIDGRLNDSFRAVNLLLDKEVTIRRMNQAGAAGLRLGDFVVSGGADAVVQDVARQTGVAFSPLATDVARTSYQVKRLRIGMYQRYYGGNMDEGWTRWLIEQWGFPYKSLMDAEIKAGNLLTKYDVIILPADRVEMMTGERRAEGSGRGGGGAGRPAEYPPEYRSGFGQEGVAALRAFVERGGTLVTFAEAGDFAIQKFELPLRNVVANRPSKEFWSPGSTLRVRIDNANPLAYGMPSDGLAVFLANNQAYEVLPTPYNERVERIVTFVERDLLQSGWLIGEDALARKAAMLSAQHGQGKIVLIGFRAQHRAQTHGTFKLVFNALLSGPDSRVTQ